jgi:hypothetical protein
MIRHDAQQSAWSNGRVTRKFEVPQMEQMIANAG